MASFEFLAIILTGLGLIASILYYSTVIRNQNKTRQAQLLMTLYETYRSPEFRARQLTIRNHEYTDFNDFWMKYGAEENPDSWAMWLSVAGFFNGIGILLKQDLIDIALLEELLSNIIIKSWITMKPIITEWRSLDEPRLERKYKSMHGFEYLFDRMKSRVTV